MSHYILLDLVLVCRRLGTAQLVPYTLRNTGQCRPKSFVGADASPEVCVVCNCQKDYGSFWTGWLLVHIYYMCDLNRAKY